MKIRPILFSTPMVKALLDGRKTQTRRLKFEAEVGDVLWVRETFAEARVPNNTVTDDENVSYIYRAEDPPVSSGWKPSIFMPKAACRLFLEVTEKKIELIQDISEEDSKAEGVLENLCASNKTCPSSLCKKECIGKGEFARYPIDHDDLPLYSAKESFQSLWHSINGEESWNSNPEVKAYSFKIVEKPISFQ